MTRQSKYGSRKIRLPDGTVFDSQRELNRWQDLQILQKAGVITELQRQVRFDLIPFQKAEKGMPSERGASYVADFTYLQDGRLVVEDAKGYRTPDYILKRKLMRWIHKIAVREV